MRNYFKAVKLPAAVSLRRGSDVLCCRNKHRENLFVFDRLVLYGLPGDKTDMNRWSEVAKKG
jgi:hypothetical protein